MILLLKIAVTPLLVVAVSLAVRWWGPTVGGILMGLPWFTGPVLFILIQERGGEFGVAACLGVEIGVICISAFILAYGLVAAVAAWPLSLAAAMVAFFASAFAISDCLGTPEYCACPRMASIIASGYPRLRRISQPTKGWPSGAAVGCCS